MPRSNLYAEEHRRHVAYHGRKAAEHDARQEVEAAARHRTAAEAHESAAAAPLNDAEHPGRSAGMEGGCFGGGHETQSHTQELKIQTSRRPPAVPGTHSRMCNLYSVTKGQQAIRELYRAATDQTGNLSLDQPIAAGRHGVGGG